MKSSTRGDVLFIDTWGWLVLADSKDPAHGRAVAERRSRTALVTTDFVLDETFTRLFARCNFSVAQKFSTAVLAAGREGQLSIERITPAHFDAAYQMRLRYRDKPDISFTDFTSFVVIQERGIRDVLTADTHFTQVQLGLRRVPGQL